MRETPGYIAKAVHEYDPQAGVVWHNGAWYLTHRGRRLFTLDHADGTPIRNLDGHLEPVMNCIRRSDLKAGGMGQRRAMELALRNRQQVQKDRAAALCAAGRKESEAVADTFRRGGPKPMVHVHRAA